MDKHERTTEVDVVAEVVDIHQSFAFTMIVVLGGGFLPAAVGAALGFSGNTTFGCSGAGMLFTAGALVLGLKLERQSCEQYEHARLAAIRAAVEARYSTDERELMAARVNSIKPRNEL
ncbi:hypothetical protein FACS1894186_5420 [Alphaproteobacteria bacterium]|nr:hypothetical protein FACS1894186_5420 [Alphaproteobacteria bacterium]